MEQKTDNVQQRGIFDVMNGMPNISKKWKKIGLRAAIVMGVLFVGFLFLFFYLSRNLKTIVVEELNKNLLVEVSIQNVNVNLFRNFPYLNLSFKQVNIPAPNNAQNALLKVEQLDLLFNPLDLAKDQISVSKILIANGDVNLIRTTGGVYNVSIFKSDSTTDNSGTVQLDLQKFELVNIDLNLQDSSAAFHLNTNIEYLQLKGYFGKGELDLEAESNCFIRLLSANNEAVLRNKFTTLDTRLKVNLDSSLYVLSQAEVAISRLKLQATGTIDARKEYPLFDLQYRSEQIDIHSLLSILPVKVSSKYKELESNGDITLSGSFIGRQNDKVTPILKVAADLNKVKFRDKSRGITIDEINGHVDFTNAGKNQPKHFVMEARIEKLAQKKSNLSAFLRIENFENPLVKFESKGRLDLRVFNLFLDPNHQMSGEADIHLNGKYDSQAKNWPVDARGWVNLKGAGYHLNGKDLVAAINGRVDIARDALQCKAISGSYQDQTLHFKGQISSIQPLINKKGRAYITGMLSAEEVEIHKLFGSDTEEQSPTSTPSTKTFLPPYLELDLSCNVASAKYHDLTFNNALFNCYLSEDQLHFGSLDTRAFAGKISGEVDVKSKGNTLKLTATLDANAINISNLFKEFNSFGMEDLTEDNISGIADMSIVLDCPFDVENNVVFPAIKSTIGLKIKQGRLKDYQALEALSKFVDLKELRDVKFDELNNTLEIKNNQLVIPGMEVKNSALSLYVEGTHTFDNYLNYHLKISLTDLLAKRSGWLREKQERKLEENQEGGLNAYILMKGYLDNLAIKYDKAAVKEKVKEDWKEEKKTFARNLRNELRRKEKQEIEQKEEQFDKSSVWDE